MHAVATMILALALIQVVVEPSEAGVVEARLVDSYPIVEALLHVCPVEVEAYINGVDLGGVPFKATPSGSDCNVTVDLSGTSAFRLYPGDNMTLVYKTPAGNIKVGLLLQADSQTASQGGIEEYRSNPPIILDVEREDNTPGKPEARNAWLAASIVLAAAALLAGAREYAGE